MRSPRRSTFSILRLTSACTVLLTLVGCGLGGLALLPFASVTSVQLFDQPNYTVAFSVESALVDPGAVAKINWVFGDGSGFVEGDAGRTTITYRYASTGTYSITAYVFDAAENVVQIYGSAKVVANGGEEPSPNPTPEDLPGAVTGPNPANGATTVAVDRKLTWTSSVRTDSYDVYLGKDEVAVTDADNTAAVFMGNQTERSYDPAGLDPDTEYFWRIDSVNALGTTKGEIYSFTTAKAPKTARDFQPVDGITTARVDVVLSWTAGSDATSHDIYFGKTLAEVTDATNDTDDVFKGNQTATTFDPEDEAADEPGELLPSTAYYWRIDEVGPGGTTKGAVLAFTTAAPPAAVTSPTPADGDIDQDVGANLGWLAVPAIESFDVYFGIDPIAVENATKSSPEFEGNQTSKSFDPGVLLGSTTYYWRIDTRGAGGTAHGALFSFTTAEPPAQVAAPFTPANNATNVSVLTTIEWNLGGGGGITDSFDVYFSTVQSAVTNGLASAFAGNQDVLQTVFDPGELVSDTDYFWRIDAVGPGGKTTGTVQKFHTGALPEQVEDPSPANGEEGVELDVVLAWSAALGADSYNVYFGTNQSNVSNAGVGSAQFKGTQAGTTFDPMGAADLQGNTDYFWRIDAKSPGGTTKGDVWSFRTAPGKANNPDPLDQDTGIALNAQLGWTAGAGAVSHDVFFGTDMTAVANATTSTVGIFKGNQAGTSFDPGALLGVTTYYWRIDEVGDPADGVTKGDVWEFTTGAGQASTPISPTNGATGVALAPTLTWMAGTGAAGHDVYFGTSSAAVENATTASAEYMTTLLIGTEMYDIAGPLDGNTSYYWRIDELDADDNVTKGKVWQFRTRTGPAMDPDPADEETGITLNAQLSWTLGSGATTSDVYFGTDMTAVQNATPATAGIFKGNQAATTFNPGALDGNTPYYWRIDSKGPAGTSAGDVWSFTTRSGKAALPIDPANGAVGIELDPTLMWSAGAGAVSHDIYFGTTLSGVENATLASAEYKGNVLLGTESYTPASPLAANTSHYWRIDEVDADDNVTKGSVWQFKTITGAASDPIPEDDDVGIDVNTVLSWTAGEGATSYDIYFSDVEADVISGAAFVLSKTGTTYDPGLLDGATTYFWRIDAVGPGGTSEGEIWSFTTGAGQATDPDPLDGQAGIGLLPTLQWTPGVGTTTQDIYFGTSETAVGNANRFSAQFQGNVPGGASSFVPDPLSGLTFYYWRIDSVTLDGTTKGEVWQFRTGPGKATNPTPADFAIDQSIEVNLTWTAGTGAVTHDVYFSETLADVVNGAPAAFQGNQAGTIFDPGTLDANKMYYWRIDEVSSGGTATTTGTVWRFRTLALPGKAGSPSPANGATNQLTTATLSWSAATGATSYDVYFSTVMADVVNGNLAAYQGDQTTRTFNPGTLTNNTTYYWRIDSINEAGVKVGDVWSFTVKP